MDVVITGIGLRSPLGNLAITWQRLCQGHSTIKQHIVFPELPAIPVAVLGDRPRSLTELVEPILQDTLAHGNLNSPLSNCGVAVGSSRGCQKDWEQLRQHPEQLSHWPYYQLATAATLTAQTIQSHGPVSAPMAACATSMWAIAQGYEWIRNGRCDRALVGAVEAPITPLTLASFKRMGALATTGCYPFDRDREGLVLGEGGAMFLLETRELAQARNASIYGVLKGFGFTADAYHVSAPNPDGRLAQRAIGDCLSRSQLRPTNIDYIHAHGTSTHLNDQQEAQLIEQMFPHYPAVSSTKGATGHTLGASGAMGLAFSLMALRDQLVPPCIGLRSPEFPINVVAQACDRPLQNILVLSFGFGGQNTVLAVSRNQN